MSKRDCGEHAAFRFTWPGKPESYACVDHAMQVMGVANAIGLPLQLIPLGYRASDPIPSEFPTCKQQVSAAPLPQDPVPQSNLERLTARGFQEAPRRWERSRRPDSELPTVREMRGILADDPRRAALDELARVNQEIETGLDRAESEALYGMTPEDAAREATLVQGIARPWPSTEEERLKVGEGITPAMQQAGVRGLRDPYWEPTDYARVCVIYKAMEAARAQSGGGHSPEAWLIFYDDAEVKPELFAGAGAEEGARNRFAAISANWNAHLFALVESNSRDARKWMTAPLREGGAR